MPPIHWLDPRDGNTAFPSLDKALNIPNGLLAAGGDLSAERLLGAYRHGIFPWYNEGQPILWWSPDPRMVLFPERLKISRSLRKSLHQSPCTITLDTAFREVMEACAEPRRNQDGTWIRPEMIEAYCSLHKLGHAHSVEAWHEGTLVGGLYGVAIGLVFFGESMFTRQTDASKIAFVHLVRQLRQWGYKLIDCQVYTNHLHSLGAEELPRPEFIDLLECYCTLAGHPAPWRLESSPTPL